MHMAMGSGRNYLMVVVMMNVVVSAGVLMLQFLMDVLVLVRFSQMQHDPGQHQRATNP